MVEKVALTELPAERLEQELVDTAARLWRHMAHWLDLVAEFDRREGWLAWECRSASEWLSWHCGVAPGTARDQVRVARALAALPATREAFASGALSYSKVRALVRVVTPESEASLVDFATACTAAQLERILAAVRRAVRGGLDAEAAMQHEQRRLDWFFDDDGSLVIQGRLPADDGAELIARLQPIVDQLGRDDRAVSAETGAPGRSHSAVSEEARAAATDDVPADDGGEISDGSDSGDDPAPDGPATGDGDEARVVSAETPVAPRSVSQRRADALLSALRSGEGGRATVDLRVEVNAETLAGGSGSAGWTVNGIPLADHVARMLCCEAAVTALIKGPNGEVLDVGRTSRTPPPRLRAALEARDKGCVVPGCSRTGAATLDAHHLKEWVRDEGTTSLDNLVLVCRFHHRLVHQGHLHVELVAGRVRCTGRTGRPLITIEPTIRADLDDVLDHLARRSDVPLASPVALGERLDVDLAVSAVLDVVNRAHTVPA